MLQPFKHNVVWAFLAKKWCHQTLLYSRFSGKIGKMEYLRRYFNRLMTSYKCGTWLIRFCLIKLYQITMGKKFRFFVSDYLKVCSHDPFLDPIDDYAKDGGQGEVWFLCSFYHEPLRIWIKRNVNKFGISSHITLIWAIKALRSYLRPTYQYDLHTSPNTKVSIEKDHG